MSPSAWPPPAPAAGDAWPGPGPGPVPAPAPAPDGDAWPGPDPDRDWPPPGVIVCRICGSQPAVDAKFFSNRGMVLMWQYKTFRGPFCRWCGIAVFRTAQRSTLIFGWWGLISFFANCWFTVSNVANRQRVAGLAPPVDPAPRPRVKPEKSVLAGPGVVVAVVALILAGFLIKTQFSHHGRSIPSAGECVKFRQASDGRVALDKQVSCAGPNDGKVLAVITDPLACPAATTATFSSADHRTNICIATTG